MNLVNQGKTEDSFIYDSLSWGEGYIRAGEKTLAGRKLEICLHDFSSVNGRVLEVGCARGRFIRSIKNQRSDLDAFGCDINSAAIELNMKERHGVSYSVADVMRLPFEDESFDAVVFFDLLEHLEYPLSFLAEIRRVLKKGGVFHGYIPCEGQPFTLHWLLWKLRLGHNLKKKHRGHIQRFSSKECSQLCEEAGFDILKKHYSGYYIEQFLDVLFYVMLEIRGIEADLWEAHAEGGHVGSKKRSTFRKILGFLRQVAFGLGYYESKIIRFPPTALGLHITAKRHLRGVLKGQS